MKVLLVIFAVCAIINNISAGEISEDERKMLAGFKADCIAESGVDLALLEKAEKDQKLVPDEKFACFSSCILKKIGFISEDGKLDEDMVSAILSTKLPQEVLQTALKNCKNQVGKDDCDTAIKFLTCFVENGATMSISF